MKKLVFILSIFIAVNCMAQEAPKPVEFQYCEIVGTQKFLSLKVTIAVDYGEGITIGKDNRIKDENDKVKTFNSMIDALNYMGLQGWEFMQAYVVTMGQSQNVYHYLLKRKK